MSRVFVKRSKIAAPAGEVFAWHQRPGALERLTPPWSPVELVDQRGGITDGARVELRIGNRPLRTRWVAEHYGYQQGERFCDRQAKGPFTSWEHTHSFEPDGDHACWLTDRIEFELPPGGLGTAAGAPLLRRSLQRTFDYRHRVTGDDIAMHVANGKGKTMNVLVTGASGLLGSVLAPALTTGGHSVRKLVRSRPTGKNEVHWDPAAGKLDPGAFDGIDAVVHLAGETVAGRWSDSKKRKIMDSRRDSTKLLAETMAALDSPPKVFVCASAIGYYGDRGDEQLTEQSSPGRGFFTDVVEAWEGATRAASDAGIRVVNTRFGLVLSPKGGLLGQILLPFKLGVGGPLGDGKQYMSWVAIDDLVGAVTYALTHDQLSGPVNVTAPDPVTNREFTKALGAVLHRPTVFKVPAVALKAILGEFSSEALGSARVLPQRLLDDGYEFRFTRIEDALRYLLGRST